MTKNSRRKGMALLLLAITLVMIVVATIVVPGLRDDTTHSDVGIVLGSRIMPDGTPSPRLQARLDRAGELWQAGAFPSLIVSGGVEPEGWDEAQIMADNLITRWQIPAAAILLDHTGNTTHDTACHSVALMRQHGFKSAMLISQYFHIVRARAALKQAGIQEVHHAHARYMELRDGYSVAREVIALPVYYWRHAERCE